MNQTMSDLAKELKNELILRDSEIT